MANLRHCQWTIGGLSNRIKKTPAPLHGKRSQLPADVLCLLREKSRLVILDGILYRSRQSDEEKRLQLVLPKAIRNRALRGLHDDVGHLVPINVTEPMELLAMDFLSLEKGKGNYENILVVTDAFTKFSWAFPLAIGKQQP